MRRPVPLISPFLFLSCAHCPCQVNKCQRFRGLSYASPQCRWKDRAIREALKMLLCASNEVIWILHSFRDNTTTTLAHAYSLSLSLAKERSIHGPVAFSVDILCLSRYTPSFLLSFHTRFSGTSVSPLIVHSAGLWRMTRSFFSSTTRSPIILLDASDRSFYYFLSLFFFYLFHSSSMSRFSATLLSPLPLSRPLSASSLRFMFTLTQTGNTEIENVDSPNAKPGRYPHHRPAIRLFTGR